MSEFRLTFVKEGRAAWISHLDLLRTFQRVFIRSGMVIRHSNGFHPHPIMSFVLPLSVGQTSACELLDFETAEDLPAAEFPARLNPYLPSGVEILDCWTPAGMLSLNLTDSLRISGDLWEDWHIAPTT